MAKDMARDLSEVQAQASNVRSRASTSCWKTYDLNLSLMRALMDVAWGTATALYLLGICAKCLPSFCIHL